MVEKENHVIMISAIQHYDFCKRQCALIHIEQQWSENYFTAAGLVLHENVHEQGSESRNGKRIERDVVLFSSKLGLSGRADLVEFWKDAEGKLVVFPVEYKRGKPKISDCDLVQLCCQVLCLEELTGTVIQNAAIFYGKIWHRYDVKIDSALREKTIQMVSELRDFLETGLTPLPEYSKKCETCSLYDLCLPKDFDKNFSILRYLKKGIRLDEKTS